MYIIIRKGACPLRPTQIVEIFCCAGPSRSLSANLAAVTVHTAAMTAYKGNVAANTATVTVRAMSATAHAAAATAHTHPFEPTAMAHEKTIFETDFLDSSGYLRAASTCSVYFLRDQHVLPLYLGCDAVAHKLGVAVHTSVMIAHTATISARKAAATAHKSVQQPTQRLHELTWRPQ